MGANALLDDVKIKVDGIRALNKALGRAGALRFMSMAQREPTDYVEISRDLYRGQSVDGIFKRASKNWKRART